jgi:hypothetical protein
MIKASADLRQVLSHDAERSTSLERSYGEGKNRSVPGQSGRVRIKAPGILKLTVKHLPRSHAKINFAGESPASARCSTGWGC